MRTNRVIDATVDEVERAKETALSLMGDFASKAALDIFYTDNLQEIESGIKNLNEFSSKCWLFSSVAIYTLVYDKAMYKQSGLTWAEYSMQARQRLGIDQRDISEQLSAARFFIKNREALEHAGYDYSCIKKLARAELALSLCGNIEDVIRHIVSDSWIEFKNWYTTFKKKAELEAPEEYIRTDIEINGSKVYIKGIEAVNVSDSLPEKDKERLTKYILQIFEAMKQGYEPAIIPVYDEKEASIVKRLRDKYRQGK